MKELTMLNLRFTARVESTIQLGDFKGSALRGAWQSHLRTLYCNYPPLSPLTQGGQKGGEADPLHQQLCPVCYLLSRETNSGVDRRPYSFRPPLSDQTRYEVGESLVFEVSLFGEAQQHLAYLVVAVGEMGLQQGLGQTIHAGHKRGRFRLVQLEAVDPFRGAVELLLDVDSHEGDAVRWPTLQITEAGVLAAAERLSCCHSNSSGDLKSPDEWGQESNSSGDFKSPDELGQELTLRFLTPMRLIVEGKLVKRPEFGPFFRRLLERWSALRQQFAEQPPLDNETWDRLMALAESVVLVRDECRWQEVRGHSTRLDRAQELGGLMGTATYRLSQTSQVSKTYEVSPWRELWPYLLWGQVMQVGKNTVKGAGVYQLVMSNE